MLDCKLCEERAEELTHRLEVAQRTTDHLDITFGQLENAPGHKEKKKAEERNRENGLLKQKSEVEACAALARPGAERVVDRQRARLRLL